MGLLIAIALIGDILGGTIGKMNLSRFLDFRG